jgi:hypothetical protein
VVAVDAAVVDAIAALAGKTQVLNGRPDFKRSLAFFLTPLCSSVSSVVKRFALSLEQSLILAIVGFLAGGFGSIAGVGGGIIITPRH